MSKHYVLCKFTPLEFETFYTAKNSDVTIKRVNLLRWSLKPLIVALGGKVVMV